jgi:alanyl-tRNA synthetase
MIIIDSAHKHGISDADIVHVFENAVNSIILEEFPVKVMLFGFDTAGRALEIGYFVNDNGDEIIMHAMKLRKIYQKYLFL